MILVRQRPDSVGTFVGTLCLIHCIATPFIFIAQTHSLTCCSNTPLWWQYIDFFFLIILFFSIHQTAKNNSNRYIKPLLWISWYLLFIVIINEKAELLILNDNLIYVPALSLIILHLYNPKYCRCNKNKCFVN